jgi:RNA polymerase sigma factor (sigma-70 family)
MDVCRARIPRRPAASAGGLPHLQLRAAARRQAGLLTHDDVITLFHEFGHGLHHMLTEVAWPSVGGISGVEWDAVELPSQFMENFGWQRATLDLFARHWQTGEPLPQALFDKMLAARHFHAGLFLVRQLEFALFDFRLHLEFDPARGRAHAGAARRRARRGRGDPTRRPGSASRTFTHVFAGGYAAGYYSYLWAEVLSPPMPSPPSRRPACSMPPTGARYRREILAVGGSRPALESFIAFRGREPAARGAAAQLARQAGGVHRLLRRHGAEARLLRFEDEAGLESALAALLPEAREEPAQRLAREQATERVHSVLDRLPPLYAECLEGKYVLGLSVRELGERLGRSEKAIESTLSRARQAFRDAFLAGLAAENCR